MLVKVIVIGAYAVFTLAALVPISSSSAVKGLSAGFLNKAVATLSVSWGAIGSFFLGPFVWGLVSRKATKFGATGAAVLGLGTCLGLAAAVMAPAEAGTIGMIVSFAAVPLLSPVF